MSEYFCSILFLSSSRFWKMQTLFIYLQQIEVSDLQFNIGGLQQRRLAPGSPWIWENCSAHSERKPTCLMLLVSFGNVKVRLLLVECRWWNWSWKIWRLNTQIPSLWHVSFHFPYLFLLYYWITMWCFCSYAFIVELKWMLTFQIRLNGLLHSDDTCALKVISLSISIFHLL